MALTKVKNSNLDDADLVTLADNGVGIGANQIVQRDGSGDIPGVLKSSDAGTTFVAPTGDGSALTGVVVDTDIGTTVLAPDGDGSALAGVVVDTDIGTTVLAPDGDGSGLTGVDSLPSQSSQSGKFLTTNGSAASWGEAGGAWNLITTTTPSSSTYVTFSGLSSSYTRYVILIDGAKPTASGSPNLVLEYYIGGWKTTGYAVSEYAKRFDVAAVTPWYATNYFAHKIPDTTPISYDSGGVSAQVTITGHAGTDLFERKVEVLGVASYNSTGSALGEPALFHSIGGWNGTGAMTAIRFRLDSGYYLKGTFKLYGIN
jgi:hypothetical protein